MAKKRKRKSATVYDYDAAFKYGLISDRVGAEIDRRATRLQHHLEQLGREQEELEAQQLADSYRARRLAEEQAAKTIAPQFISYITGSTPEEIEHSIELAKQKTAEIATAVRQHQELRQLRGQDGRFIGQPAQDEQQIVEDVQNMSLRDWATERSNYVRTAQGMWS